MLEGFVLATREEAAAVDSALGWDASRFFPIRSASIPQRAADDVPIVARGRHVMPEARKARVRVWEERIRRCPRTIHELALATGMLEARVQQIIRSGTLPTMPERVALIAALGGEQP